MVNYEIKKEIFYLPFILTKYKNIVQNNLKTTISDSLTWMDLWT